MAEVTGTLRLSDSGYDRIIVQTGDEEKEVHMNDVESIAPVGKKVILNL